MAWVVALWLSVGPAGLALAVVGYWHLGSRTGWELVAAWGLLALSTVAQWEVSGWQELVGRPIVLAMMLWIGADQVREKGIVTSLTRAISRLQS
ncbi:hypothetical protein ABZ897_40915 [Nonomuraea sp. NPDC046802]|uniref:hypothetical protein n=1 Tax=Nonomuraea sp. NPDC046802 TaxID=3154919 RepID=UPI0033D48FEA